MVDELQAFVERTPVELECEFFSPDEEVKEVRRRGEEEGRCEGHERRHGTTRERLSTPSQQRYLFYTNFCSLIIA